MSSFFVPLAIGSFLFLPLGLLILRHGDPILLRWIISAAILACVAILWSGYRYAGPRGPAVSVAAGAVAGTLSGIAQIPGPQVIAYWMASGLPALIVRANLLTLFLIGEFVTLGNLWFTDMLEPEPVTIEVTGAGKRLGPQTVPLRAGSTGFWVQATGSGKIDVTVTSDRLGTQRLAIAAG